MKAILSLSLIYFISMQNINAQEIPQNNKHFSHIMQTVASPDAVWNIWTDVANWKDWDTGLKDASMKTNFKLGSKGSITSLEGRKSKFKVVSYKKGISYTLKTKLPLGSLYIKRTLQKKDSSVYFIHEVWFKGLTSNLFAKRFGPKFRAMLPEVMEEIKRIAEK